MSCRCGRDDVEGQHLCHWGAYTCPAPGRPRLVAQGPAHVAGQSLKYSAYETWACDAHWDQFKAETKARGDQPNA